jgi:hypothetical protein
MDYIIEDNAKLFDELIKILYEDDPQCHAFTVLRLFASRISNPLAVRLARPLFRTRLPQQPALLRRTAHV